MNDYREVQELEVLEANAELAGCSDDCDCDLDADAGCNDDD